MTTITSWVEEVLRESAYAVIRVDDNRLLFENSTVIGFVVEFPTIAELIDQSIQTLTSLTSQYQLALRRSGNKTWNAYAVLLTPESTNSSSKAVLQSIEENLIGTRKIVRGTILSRHSVVQALLPLLPLQRSPDLPLIDMQEEISSRVAELPEAAMKAFFSTASEAIALQVIEETR